ncbi:squalene--hopene cyclase [Paenibacillus agricola]|uniref:Squalene--hopene cyclase n=1 Tax=Paenibacillus agricola TaxID=2716264 RepID=A0ABX0JFG0_9BACL|nr:squalene--hopene cyclase [Paenibacillus agricola]NHN35285.1 squalene--hopene cyclase [Paenibacillus agricola]
MDVLSETNREIQRLTEEIMRMQKKDGSWRFCFENGTLTDAYMIITLRTLQMDNETLIRQLHDRILTAQQADGSWRVFFDEEEGNLSATVEAYYALLYSGYSKKTDESMEKAKQFILSKGGIQNITNVLTKVFLAATGHYPWPSSTLIPIEFLLLPTSFPINFFDFSAFIRVHLAPLVLLVDRQFVITTDASPDLSDLAGNRLEPVFFNNNGQHEHSRGLQHLLKEIKTSLGKLVGVPKRLHEAASKWAEQYMLERIEPDGTLYSYATCTFMMIFALLSSGYDKQHPVITSAVQGLVATLCHTDGKVLLQNSPSEVWDTALLSHALQESGTSAGSMAIQNAASYLLSKQHWKFGDWSVHNRNPVPGGWGFSDSNTINPDVDDTTAALRAIKRLTLIKPSYRDAWNRGLNWTLSMQNKDGGWPAFEKDTDHEILTWLPVDEAKTAAIDPSTTDLTGRTLEFLGSTAGLGLNHSFIRRGTNWLIDHQEADGSWYGRWGICYIYGTWAALTGMMSAGVEPHHQAVQKGIGWLLSIQNADGGWGESCKSDQLMRYMPLGASTPSQTAWALDALIAVHPKPIPEMEIGIRRLISTLHEDDWTTTYPTGAGLASTLYIHYHSYRYIWPLLTLSHYRKKYGG